MSVNGRGLIGLAACLLIGLLAVATVAADNSARFVGPGIVGNALRLDGRNYVTFNGLGKLDQVTISLWVKPGKMTKVISAILNTPGWGRDGLFHFQMIDDGKIRASLCGGPDIESITAPGLNTGKWQHLAYTYDSATGKSALYVDGKPDATGQGRSGIRMNLDRFAIGAWDRGSRGFVGDLDDVRIYSKVLDSESVREIFVQQGGDAYLVGRWTFDSLNGDIYADTSENPHDGRIASSGPAPVRPLEKVTSKEIADLGITDIKHGFVSTNAADDWEHALTSGNGVMGALVMSDALSDTIILSRHGLWLPLHEPLPPVDTASHLTEIRKMMSEGKYQDAADYVVKLSHDEGWGYKRWTDPLVPAFDIKVDMHPSGETSDYLRGVNWQTGAAGVRWKDSRGVFVRKVFVSRPDNVVVMQITGPSKGSISCDLSLAQHVGAWGCKPPEIRADGDWLTYRGSFTNEWPGSLQGYDGAVRIVTKGGNKAIEESGVVTITGADEVLVLGRVELNFNYSKSKLDDIKKSLQAIGPDFAALLAKHVKVHGEIFNRVKLDLGGSTADHTMFSEDLIAKSQVGALNKALLEEEFDASRYAILSSSGEAPPTLQGIWAGTYNPPWSSDYTQNGNLQSAIASELSTNMPEAMLAYFKYLESQLPAYRENAKRMYGARGIHVPSRTSSHGLNNHFDEVWPMTFWTAGAGWAAHFFYDYYLYTGDKDFLTKHALPFMKEAAAFYEDFLITGPDGKYIFSPSYSPENNPGNNSSQACVNATMDIAVCRELLTNLVTVCKEQKIEREKVKLWESMIAKLPDYMINKDGAVKEWTLADLDDNYGHRHCSHLYALFDGIPADIANNPKLQAAFKKAADLRMDVRRRENGGVMAFGLVQLGLAFSSLRDAQSSYDAVDWLANKFWFPNMATTHNPKELFNTDLSGGEPAIIVKMLVASQPGTIELIPALPKQWPTGKIEGLPCRGQVTVISLEWKPGLVKVTLQSAKRQNVTLRLPSAIKSAKVASGKASVGKSSKDNCRVIGLPVGKTVSLEIGI